MKRHREIQTAAVVAVVVLIASHCYIRRIYRQLVNRSVLGIVHQIPGTVNLVPGTSQPIRGTVCQIPDSKEGNPTSDGNVREERLIPFDIVAVHGLGAHPIYSWTTRDPVERARGHSGRVSWLNAFLPLEFPRAHIMTFGHNANWIVNAPHQTSQSSAQKLLDAILKWRKTLPQNRPIIFIAHSFGGIVVKDALIKAADNYDYKDIHRDTRGVIFLGTPHRGSNLSQFAYYIAAAAMPFLGSNTALLRSLRYHENDLDVNTNNFIKSCPDVYKSCFFERIPTYFLGLSLNVIVDEHSATFDWSQNYNKLEAETDHSGLNKFVDRMDTTFVQVCTEIERALSRPPKAKSLDHQQLQEHLQPAEDAAFDSVLVLAEHECLDSTRLKLLNLITDWCNTPDSQRILWLRGLPGTGKSSIARTVAKRFLEKGLGASFFFSASDGRGRGPKKLFPTVAYQLAINLERNGEPTLPCLIRKALVANPDIRDKTLAIQWKTLLCDPLSKMKKGSIPSPGLILIVDALDECDNQESVKEILQLLSKSEALDTVPILSTVRDMLSSNPNMLCEVNLDDTAEFPVKDDIFHFLTEEFKEVRTELKFKNDEKWPDEETFEKLVQMADPVFEYAATAYRFVRDAKYRNGTKDRLSCIVQDGGKIYKESPIRKLETLYNTLLDVALRDQHGDLLEDAVGPIVILRDSLSVGAIAKLTGKKEEDLDDKLRLFTMVLDIPPDKRSPIRVHHQAFRDFLLSKPPSDGQFFVDIEAIQERLLKGCIGIIKEYLQRGICDRPSTAMLTGVTNGSVEQHNPPEEVQYACQYWVEHFQKPQSPQATKSSASCDDLVHSFLLDDFLLWIEALSLMGKTSEGILAMTSLESTLMAGDSSDLRTTVCDARRFIQYNRSIIEEEPIQLYSSSLIFAPEMSIIRQTFQCKIPSWFSGLARLQKDWSPIEFTLEGHDGIVSCLAFSDNGKLVSGSEDTTVQVWNVSTGQRERTLRGHSDEVISVAFSSDGRKLASGSEDKTVVVWDIPSGWAKSIIIRPSSQIQSLVFLPNDSLEWATTNGKIERWEGEMRPLKQMLETQVNSHNPIVETKISQDGSRVAAKLRCHLKIWDIGTAQPRVLQNPGFGDFAFSHDGRRLAAISDECLEVWDIATGQTEKRYDGLGASAEALTFSPDSDNLASASGRTVRILNVAEGKVKQKFDGHSSPVSSIAFSHDGSMLASGCEDGAIRMWNVATVRVGGEQASDCHLNRVTSVVFSPDGTKLATGSNDHTVRVWAVSTGRVEWVFAAPSGEIYHLEFSPGGRELVAISEHNTFRMWDVVEGEILLKPRDLEVGYVNGVAFSPKDRKLMLGCGRRVKVWGLDAKKVEQEFSVQGLVKRLAFSQDGSELALACNDGSLSVWHKDTKDVEKMMELLEGLVVSLAFSCDSRKVASASRDTILVWDIHDATLAKEGQNVRPTWLFGDRPESITDMVFSSDGGKLAVAFEYQYVKVYDLATRNSDRTLKFQPEPLASVFTSGSDGPPPLPSYAVDSSGQWVTRDGKKILYLPLDYRPVRFARNGCCLSIVAGSGRVAILNFRPDYEGG